MLLLSLPNPGSITAQMGHNLASIIIIVYLNLCLLFKDMQNEEACNYLALHDLINQYNTYDLLFLHNYEITTLINLFCSSTQNKTVHTRPCTIDKSYSCCSHNAAANASLPNLVPRPCLALTGPKLAILYLGGSMSYLWHPGHVHHYSESEEAASSKLPQC